MYSCGPLHKDEQKKYDQIESTYSSSEPIRDVILKTYRKQWIIEKGGDKRSGISVLMARHDDQDDDARLYCCFLSPLVNHIIGSEIEWKVSIPCTPVVCSRKCYTREIRIFKSVSQLFTVEEYEMTSVSEHVTTSHRGFVMI